ncbi:putative ribonuclease H-like domain-containing protein [Tanacetum coccineum]
MTRNKAYLVEYQDYNGGPVAFGGSKGQVTGKGKIITRKLDFEDVYFVKELKQFNLFSVSQMCDKKNKVLFTDSECLMLSLDFKLPDENQVLLRVPRQNNMYSLNLENIVPTGGLACLISKATVDESNKWHRRLGYVNFKNLNKLVKGNLVRVLPSKIFQNDHTCVACQKGKQHKASCKAKVVSSISQPLQLLHMDLFGPTSVRSINHKTYCLVITDDFSRFSWVFFLRTKDETSGILKDFIRQIENQLNQKVKTNRCDNGTEFKNSDIIEFCGSKGIKREYSNARTSQQNGVAKRKNRTLIEVVRTMYQIHSYLTLFGMKHPEPTQAPLYSIMVSYTSTVKSSEAKNGDVKPNRDTGQSQREPKDQEGSSLFGCWGPSYPDLTNYVDQDDSQIPDLVDIYGNLSNGIYTNASYDDEGAVPDFTNLETTVNVNLIPTSRIHSIHPTTQILGDPTSAVQTRSKMNKSSRTHALKISQALKDESWVDAMQEELLNKKDERGVVVRNKARLVAQGYRQEEGIDYDKVFAPVARMEAIRIFLAFASYMGFIVYQMDMKSAFFYGTIDGEVYVSQPPGFVDPKFPKKVYKVVKALYGLHQAPRAWYATLSTFLLKSGYRRGTIDKTLFIKKDRNDIIVKTANTLIETQKPLIKDEEAADVDVHLYRSMIGSLMYLTTSRPDIMYLKGKPKLGLWYPRVSSFDLEAYSNSDYAGANLNRKSTTGEAEYVAAANCCGQVLWIQNQMLDYGFNFMNTKIYIDNESTICIVKNLVFHSKTKHIEIRHHFIRDAYEKKLIQVLKIHTDDNVADLLTKAFNVMDFFTRSSIYYSLTVSPTVSTSLIEQFWNTATSKTVNDVSYIKAKVVGKTVSISKAFIRRDLLFHDVDGIDYLTNQEIYENLQLMGFVQVFLNNQLSNLPAPLDNLPIPVLTKKGEGSAQPTEPQPTPSPTQPSTGDQPPVTESSYRPDTTQVPRDSLEGTNGSKGDQVQSSNDRPHSGGNTSKRAEGGLNLQVLHNTCTLLSQQVLDPQKAKDAQAAKIFKLKKIIKKLEKKCKPSISHHRAWLKSVQRLSMKKRLGKKESISK